MFKRIMQRAFKGFDLTVVKDYDGDLDEEFRALCARLEPYTMMSSIRLHALYQAVHHVVDAFFGLGKYDLQPFSQCASGFLLQPGQFVCGKVLGIGLGSAFGSRQFVRVLPAMQGVCCLCQTFLGLFVRLCNCPLFCSSAPAVRIITTHCFNRHLTNSETACLRCGTRLGGY